MNSCHFSCIILLLCRAAVSCSPTGPGLGGVKIGSGMTGKPCRAWHWCMGGAWVVHGCMAA